MTSRKGGQMWNRLFGKKQGLDAGDHWAVAEGRDGEMPLIFRIREIPDTFDRRRFPHLISIQWSFEPVGQGMPDQETQAKMNEMEERLLKTLEGTGQAVLTVIVTGNGIREFQWYAPSPDIMMAGLNKALAGLPPLPIEISGEEDPNWEAYGNFRS